MSASAFAESGKTKDECNTADFDRLVEELTSLTAELEIMKVQDSNGKYSEEIQNKEQEISAVKSCLLVNGADTFNDEMMRRVVMNADYSGAITEKSTPDLSNLAAQLNQMYDAYGKESTYYDGNKNYKVYEIYITHSSSKRNGIPLQKVTTNHVLYNKINAGSTEASNWVNEVLDVYVSKGISYIFILEKYNPIIKYLPYEIFFSSKPSSAQISSPGGAMVLTLNTVTSIKFTYVLDEATDTWKLCLSTNLVSAAFTCTECLSIGGKATNKSKDYPTKTLYGGYTSSVPNAVTVFKNMINNSSISSGNLGLNTVSYKSAYKGSLSHTVPNPSSPLGL